MEIRSVMLACLLAVPVVAAPPAGGDDAIVLHSAGEQVALVELFTSEGCSSCPPADRWLGDLESDAGLWDGFVPVALHVDYWDYIGWPDRFAKSAYSDRQRRYAAEGGNRVVYTPGLFVDGREWTGWRSGRDIPRGDGPAGRLEVRVDGDRVTANFEAARGHGDSLVLNLALLGMDLVTEVRAGENHGRRLAHDFVVLGLRSVRLAPDGSGFSATTRLPRATLDAPRHALAAWVSSADSQAPLQATGGYLP